MRFRLRLRGAEAGWELRLGWRRDWWPFFFPRRTCMVVFGYATGISTLLYNLRSNYRIHIWLWRERYTVSNSTVYIYIHIYRFKHQTRFCDFVSLSCLLLGFELVNSEGRHWWIFSHSLSSWIFLNLFFLFLFKWFLMYDSKSHASYRLPGKLA